MEYSTPLIKYKSVNDITPLDVIQLGIDISQGLEICHKHNIIHRDIKEANIFVSKDGCYKLGDFSISKDISMTISNNTIAEYI